VSFISASPSGNCSEQNGRVTCAFTELAAGDPPLDILIQVSADQVGIADNTATVTADQVDPDMSDNTSTWQTDIFLPSADLALELDPESAVLFVPRSWPFYLRFFIANLGPSTAENTVLTITTDIPSSKVYVDPPCNDVSNNGYATFVCNLGDWIVGGPQALDVELSISQRGNYTFNASITTTTFDPDPSNNVFGPGTIDVY
jgi:hypothetical protein